jgi:DNA-binding LacI/PurR family transcriptional regulator
VKQHTKNPTKIGVTAPVGKAIPTGKKIVAVSCGQPGCTDAVNYFQDAAKVLGWQVTVLTTPSLSPQDIQKTEAQAVAMHPDAVVTTSTSLVYFQRQAAQLKAQKIPLIALYGAEPSGGPITVAIANGKSSIPLAALQADKVVADLGGKGTVGVAMLSDDPVVTEFMTGFTGELKKVCPSCKLKTVTFPPTALGSTAGRDMANFLRANPDVKALMLSFEGEGNDLASAAKSAAITLPKTYSIITTVSGIPALQSGQRTATVPGDFASYGWQAADALARIFTGQTASAQKESVKNETPVIWSKDYNNLPNAPAGAKFLPPIVTDYQAQFKKLWGK